MPQNESVSVGEYSMTALLSNMICCQTIKQICLLVMNFHNENSFLRSALLNAGYKVSISHANPMSIKTNAPNDVIWDIIRAWVSRRELFHTVLLHLN